MVDIFDEVEDDLRAERAERLLKKYAWLIAAVVLAIIGAAVGWQLWLRWQTQQDMAAAQHYISAQSAADAATVPGAAPDRRAIGALDQQAASAPEGYRTLARLRAAGLKADAGDLAGASTLWNQVAADPAAGPLLRDLATLMWAQHQLDHADPPLLEARLKPLATPDNAWSALAREQLALLDLRQGKADDASKALKALAADVTAPAGVRQRASAVLAGLNG